MMNKYTVDRFEGDHAVLLVQDNEAEQVLVLREKLPANVREGDILKVSFHDKGNDVSDAIIMEKETQTAKKRTEDLIQKLLDKNK